MSTENPIKSEAFKDNSSLPRYEQLKQIMLEQIHSGALKPGDRIATEVELCKHYRWSRPTISRALNELEIQGVLTRIQGSGTFVASPTENVNKTLNIMVCDGVYNPGNEYNGLIFQGIRDVAAENRLDVVYYKQTRIPEPKVVNETGVDGVLLYAPNIDDLPAILKLQEVGKPVVAMAMHSRIKSISSVSSENYEGMKKTVRHLVGLGHRRIGLVTHGLASSDVQERILGFQHEILKTGIELNPAWMLLSTQPITNGVLENWFDSFEERPTAFIVCLLMAFPLLHLAWSRQLTIPKDLSIIATDDSELFSNCSPTISAIRQPLYDMGRRSLTKLLGMIRERNPGPAETLPLELVLRDSVSSPGQNGQASYATNPHEHSRPSVNTVGLRILKEPATPRPILHGSLPVLENGLSGRKTF